MTYEASLRISSYVANIIAAGSAVPEITPEEILRARRDYSDEKLELLRAEGFYRGDFELFYVLFCFCKQIGLFAMADRDYLRRLFSQAKRFEAAFLTENPYVKSIRIRERRIGDFLLTESRYDRGEIFQFDMPPLRDEVVVPRLGFFSRQVRFPAVYEGNIPWVSVCPSEILSMERDISAAHGRVLVLGLGLGYYPFMVAKKGNSESITVIEKSPEIIRLFTEEILPYFHQRDRIRILCADAFDYLKNADPEAFDFCYADIWEGAEDGAAAYLNILPYERAWKKCEFRYWIRDEILWYLEKKSRKA